MVNHLGSQPQIDAVGGIGKQESAQTANHAFHQRDHHQGQPQDLQRVHAALGDHLVDDHLDKQGVGQAEQLHHEGGQQHLQQHAPIAAQGRPEPTRSEAALGGGGAALQQQQFEPIWKTLLDLSWAQLDPAIGRRSQPQSATIAAGNQGKAVLPGHQARGDQAGGGTRLHLGATDQQAEHGGNLATELQIGFLAAAQLFLQHLVDGVAAIGQIHQLAQHLEAGQRLFGHAPRSHKLQPPGGVVLTQIKAGGQGVFAPDWSGGRSSWGCLELRRCGNSHLRRWRREIKGARGQGEQPQGERWTGLG